jgi:hypothetical protein
MKITNGYKNGGTRVPPGGAPNIAALTPYRPEAVFP